MNKNLLGDLVQSFRAPGKWIFSTWFKFLLRYRRTSIGPLWILAGPVFFILFLGALFVGLSQMPVSVFIPHLGIGVVLWTLVGGYMNRSHTLFNRNVGFLIHGKTRLTDIILMDNFELFLHFLHQGIIIVALASLYPFSKWTELWIPIVGLILILLNGFWISVVLGILGARFKDLGHVITNIMSIAFFATPIIWMPASTGADKAARVPILELYMQFNPFYHFIEIFRGPMLGNEVSQLTWTVALSITIFGWVIAGVFYRKYSGLLVIWVQQ